jgi:hypothetical protein
MIRRAFWLGVGAVAGIMGYRRVSALGRRLSGTRTDTVTVRRAARSTIRFARDVREGMDLYMSRHPAPDALPSKSTYDRKDGR